MVADAWEAGDSYERYIGRWSRRVAPLFLSWLRIPPGQRWLDVGCGTGALCATIWDLSSPSALTGVDPSVGFLRTARERLPAAVALRRGEATSIPLADATVDVVVSGLVLNFVKDQSSALREMARVTTGGGMVAAYVWDYADGMQLIRYFWDVAVEMDPAAAPLDEGTRFSHSRPGTLADLFARAGLSDVEATAIDIPTPFKGFDEYWEGFLGGQGPAPSYVQSQSEAAKQRLRDGLRERIPADGDGSLSLTARAWAVRGIAVP